MPIPGVNEDNEKKYPSSDLNARCHSFGQNNSNLELLKRDREQYINQSSEEQTVDKGCIDSKINNWYATIENPVNKAMHKKKNNSTSPFKTADYRLYVSRSYSSGEIVIKSMCTCFAVREKSVPATC